MFSKKPTEGKRKHKEDNIDSFNYQCLDDLICSDKKDATAVDNIEDLVDSALAKNKVSSYDERVKNNYFVDSTDRLWRHGEIRKILGIVNKPLVRKVLSILLSFLLVFVTIVSASILSPQGSSDLEVLSVSLVPENVHNGDYMSVNVTVLGSYHICSVMADMGGIETINLLLSDNSSLEQLWQTVWVVHDVDVGEYVATITALDEENTSYRSEVRWSVLPQEIIEDNVSSGNGDTIDNDTFMGENESLNVNNPLDNQTSNITDGEDISLNDTPQQVNVLDNTTEYDNVSINVTTNESIDVSTTDENQSARATYLNITLNTDKDSYLVNETVFINGTVVFNNSFVETTVNLSINSSDNSFLYTINTANGAFSYEYIASKSGNYIVGAHAIFENETASINTLFIVNDITDETDDVTVLSLIQEEAVVGESVFWEKKIMVKNNASIQRTLNIATTIPDAVSNIKIQDVSEGNEVNYTVLANQIAEKNVSEQISGSTSIMFNGTFDAWGEREFTITYETPAPIKQEISYNGGKRIEIQSNATVHYSNVTAYTELPELSYKPRFYRVINGTRVDVTFDPLYNVTYLDNNSNGKYDGISWNVPRLSNDTYEIIIVITNAAHLDENRGFISDIYEEVCKKDSIWSEPIYHNEYIRVTFERNLTNRNDITFYARNNQSLNTIVEVYYYDSDEKITEFPIIEQEDFYKVYLTGMTGSHQVFDLKMKNLDNENSAYLEFDYIVDPDNKDAVDSNVTDKDSSPDVGTESNFVNCQDLAPDTDYMNIQEADTGVGVDEWQYVDGLSTAETVWATAGTSPYLNAQDQPTNYIYSSSTGAISSWYTFADTSGIGSGFTVNLSIYWQCPSGDSFPEWGIDWTGDGIADASGSFTTQSTWGWVATGTIAGLDTATEINSARVHFTHNKGGAGPDQVNIDAARLGIYKTATTNYNIDFEYNWSTADYDETNEEVCFYVGGSFPSENLNVSCWNGSSSQWDYLGNITALGWTNLTATNLTSLDYVIQLKGDNESGDSSTQDNWDIDVIMLHTWTANNPPSITGEIPANQSTDITRWPACNVTVSDQDGGTVDVYFYENTTDSWVLQQTNASVDVTSPANVVWSNYSNASQFSTTYWWSVNVTDGTDWTNETYNFTTRAQYIPDPPSPFTATTYNRTRIDLSWTKGNKADKTYIEWNSAETWNRGEGTEIYNDTGTSCSHTNLEFNTQYFYQAWSWNETDSVWSTTYASDNNTTSANSAPSYGTPSPTNGSTGQALSLIWSILINDSDADSFNWWINCSHGETNSSNDDTNGTKNLSISGLSYSTQYTVWVNTTDSYDWTREWFTFTTQGANNPPTQSSQKIWNSTTSTEWSLNATGVSLTPTCFNVTLIDNDNENMNVTLYWNDSGTWKNINDSYSDGGVANNTVWHAYNTSWINSYSTQYNISFNVTDGTDWSNETKNFTTLINTSVDTITPYNVTSSTLTINATGDFGLDNVTLWYQYSTDNSSWGGWMENITDTSSLWQWSFNFSKANGTGYYEFYSIGKKSGSPDETAPTSADAICRYLPFNVSPITWPIGSINLSENTSTTGFYFNLTNEGNISLNVQINATNATNSTTGFKWNLTSTLGHNNYTLQYNKSGGGTWTQINTSFDSFATLAVDGYQTFDLKIFMATTSDELDPMFLTVTFKYVAS